MKCAQSAHSWTAIEERERQLSREVATMQERLRVGVVGCGRIAQIAHIPYLRELPGFELAAICDISKRVTDDVGDLFGVAKRYQSYEEMLSKTDLDVVLVCNRDHVGPAIAAMDRGRHVMVEKPMAFNLEQCDQMIAAATRNNTKLMVAYMKCYDPGFEWSIPRLRSMEDIHLIRLHDFAGSEEINEEIYDLHLPNDVPQEIVEEATQSERAAKIQAIGESRVDLVSAYSLLLYLCSHDASVLHEAFGAPSRILFVEIFDRSYVVAVLEYGSNTRCVWEVGDVSDRRCWDEQLVAYGGRRSVSVEFHYPYLKNAATVVNINEMEGHANVQKRVVPSFDDAFRREWQHFHECIVEDRDPLTNGWKGRRDIAFLIDLIRSYRP
jgi:predicted dehydrogenase